jgi:antitoxin (DNA-binding transcriptional repressor) of toxin-antitoxin stability system
MKKTNISYLKQHLSACLQEVREGEEYVVLDRKRPVARITAYEAQSDDALRDELIAEGLIRPAKKPLDPNSLPDPIKVPGPPLSSYIIEEREGR